MKRKSFFISLVLVLLGTFLSTTVSGQTISPPKDGISFEIIGTYSKVEPDVVNCGYSDFGNPKNAKVTYQKRRYQEVRNGKVTRRWVENRRIKSECLPNQ